MPENFPRLKQWRRSDSRINFYAGLSELDPIPVIAHEVTSENQTYNFRYVVRVNTFNRNTEEDVSRFVSLTDDNRFAKGELLGMARDTVMNSPIASQEDFQSAEIIFALRKG